MPTRALILLLLSLLTFSCSNDTEPTGPTSKKQYSQVTGRVTVKNFDSVIQGATIRLQTGNKTASTDALGEFFLDSVELGNYTLIVEKDGFKRQNIDLVLSNSTPRRVDVTMPRLAPLGTGMFYIIILDDADSKPLGDVYIYNGSTLLGATDTTGKVTLQNSLNQRNEIQFVKPGYKSVQRGYAFSEGIVTYDTIRLGRYAEMLAWYSFAQNGIDSSGSGLHAQIEGGTFVNDRHGLKNRALQLNGTTDYVRVANAISLNFGTDKDFTICMWVKRSTKSASPPALLSKTQGTGNDLLGYQLSLRQESSSGSDYADLGYTLGSDLGVYTNYVQRKVSVDYWHFCAMRVSRKNGVILQMDNNSESSTSQILGGNLDNAADLLIGRSAQSDYFRGAIDEVMIFGGYLTDEEIKVLSTR